MSTYSWEFTQAPKKLSNFFYASMDATPLNIQIIWPQNVPVIGQISKFLGGLREFPAVCAHWTHHNLFIAYILAVGPSKRLLVHEKYDTKTRYKETQTDMYLHSKWFSEKSKYALEYKYFRVISSQPELWPINGSRWIYVLISVKCSLRSLHYYMI
jgi:hypothetical protein